MSSTSAKSLQKIEWITLPMEPEMVGLRIDKFLSFHPLVATRTKGHRLIQQDFVRVNQKPVKPSYLIIAGDKIEVHFPVPESEDILPANIPLDILYEDADILVLNKASGLVVHPAAGHRQDTLVNALVHHTNELSTMNSPMRPGIVHRLDKDTSGVLVVAKNDRAHARLASQFQKRVVHRLYEAFVHGRITPDSGVVQSFLARRSDHRKKFGSVIGETGQILRDPSSIVPHGKWAVTTWKVLARFSNYSKVQLKLGTGRTHQIRVHLSELGFPIVGDPIYGSAVRDKKLGVVPRLGLHAVSLGFHHPTTQQWMEFQVTWDFSIG